MTTAFVMPEGFHIPSKDMVDIKAYFEGNYKIVHQIKGRIRIRIPKIAYDADYTERLIHQLTSIAGMVQVNVNSVAKSITLYYRQDTTAAYLIQSLLVSAPPIPAPSVPTSIPAEPITDTAAALIPIPEGFDPEFTRILTELTRTSNWFTHESKPVLYQLTILMLQTGGSLCLVLGIVGVILPLVPGTPFLILAALCFFAASELSSH